MSGAATAAAAWALAVTPYLWLPSINGTLQFEPPPGAGVRPEASVGDDYLQHLEAALMLSAEARKGKWAVLADVIYLDFSKQNAAMRSGVDVGSQASLKGLLWQVAASRALGPSFEILGGARYFALEAGLDWQLAGPAGGFAQSGSVSQKAELLDAIAGVRGRLRLGDGGWFVPYYLDAGTGSSSLTWQGVAGIGYSFKWGEALLSYRHLYYDQKGGKLVQDIEFSGPALGARFTF